MLNPTLATLPPAIILGIARWTIADLPNLHLISKTINRALDSPSLWADYAVDAVGLEDSATWAVEGGCSDFRLIQQLLHRGASDGDMITELATAGKIELLDRILGLESVTGEMAVTAAAGRGNVEVLKLLLSRGCPTNEVALWAGTNTNNMPIVKILLDHGVRISPEAIETACVAGNRSMLQLFHTKGAVFPTTSVYCACRSSKSEIVDLVLALGASHVDSDSVIEACRINNIAMLKILLDSGAPLPMTSVSGPLETAILRHADDCTPIVQLLLGMGVPVTEHTIECAVDKKSDTNLSLLITFILPYLPWSRTILEKVGEVRDMFPLSLPAIQHWVGSIKGPPLPSPSVPPSHFAPLPTPL